jgi:hypothetical protein
MLNTAACVFNVAILPMQNQGSLTIGASAAAQASALDYRQDASGLWNVEILGLGINDFDQLSLTGVAQLSGTLDLHIGDEYVPTLGDTFNILSSSGGVSGKFTSIVQPAGLPAGVIFDVRYDSNTVQLVVAYSRPGDLNHDNSVDAADYVVWRKSDSANLQGYTDWWVNFGEGARGAAIATVPEPSTLVIFTMAAIGIHLRRRRIA